MDENSNKKKKEVKINEELNKLMENTNNKLLLKDKNILNFIEKGIEKLEEILKY